MKLIYSRRIAGLISLSTQHHLHFSHCWAHSGGAGAFWAKRGGRSCDSWPPFGEHRMGWDGMAWHASSFLCRCAPSFGLCNLHPYFKIGRHQQQHCTAARLATAVTSGRCSAVTVQSSSPEAGHCGQKPGLVCWGRWTAVATGPLESGVVHGHRGRRPPDLVHA